MSQNYHIQSQDTKYCLISHYEVEGEKNGLGSFPEHSILTVSPPVKGPTTAATVKRVKGLYVALPKDHVVGSKLIWSKEAYLWDITLTSTSTGKQTYQFVPRDGENLYWFDKFGIGPAIVVEDGAHITPPESYFTLTVA